MLGLEDCGQLDDENDISDMVRGRTIEKLDDTLNRVADKAMCEGAYWAAPAGGRIVERPFRLGNDIAAGGCSMGLSGIGHYTVWV